LDLTVRFLRLNRGGLHRASEAASRKFKLSVDVDQFMQEEKAAHEVLSDGLRHVNHRFRFYADYLADQQQSLSRAKIRNLMQVFHDFHFAPTSMILSKKSGK